MLGGGKKKKKISESEKLNCQEEYDRTNQESPLDEEAELRPEFSCD